MTIENANRLAEMRRAHGLSQEELAEKLNISRQAISKWERAESSPDTDNLIALAQLYGVSLDVLLGLQVPQRPLDEGEAEFEASTELPEDEPAAAQAPAEPEPEEADAVDTSNVDLPNGSFYEHQEQEAARERARRRSRYPYPLLVTAAYLVLGFVFHQWHPGWIIFLTIPLFYLPESEREPVRLLGNPVMVTIIYLLLGCLCNLWHPGWLVFLLIPLLNAHRR
ncbi:MAG: helix-turn-helix transcriptional regulator [Clostridia bacterium]|nr:helix-turn-helix transcriptional regulator [Clostridia bacterium]